MKIDLEFALLAPVPEEHLETGLVTCQTAGKVAFGSRAWELFSELEAARSGEPVQAFIYASHSKKFGLTKVRWRGTYVGHVKATPGGAHPDGMTFRPGSTQQYPSDSQGHWAVFWEITDLAELPKDDAIPISKFRGWQTKKNYVPSFAPEGPLIVETPEI